LTTGTCSLHAAYAAIRAPVTGIHLPLKLRCVPDNQDADSHTHRYALTSARLASTYLRCNFSIWNPHLPVWDGRGQQTEKCWSGL